MSFELFIAICLVVFWASLPAATAIAMTKFDDDLLHHHDDHH